MILNMTRIKLIMKSALDNIKFKFRNIVDTARHYYYRYTDDFNIGKTALNAVLSLIIGALFVGAAYGFIAILRCKEYFFIIATLLIAVLAFILNCISDVKTHEEENIKEFCE